MTRQTELRKPRARSVPELDVEQEVDFAEHGRRIAARWWLPALGLLAGLLLGYVLARGSSQVYRAEALVYLGQPTSPTGLVQGLSSNPRFVAEIVRSEGALKYAARRSGLRVAALRRGASTQPVSGGRGASRPGQAQLVRVSVKADAARKAERAANALAQRLVTGISPYVNAKIELLERRLRSQTRALESTDRRLRLLARVLARAGSLAPLEQLPLVVQQDSAEQRRAQLLDEQVETEQLLSLARLEERARIVEPAAARRTTARSPRNSMLAGGALGLLLGGLAALLWDPLSARASRGSAR